jgi:hypothetical protein
LVPPDGWCVAPRTSTTARHGTLESHELAGGVYTGLFYPAHFLATSCHRKSPRFLAIYAALVRGIHLALLSAEQAFAKRRELILSCRSARTRMFVPTHKQEECSQCE